MKSTKNTSCGKHIRTYASNKATNLPTCQLAAMIDIRHACMPHAHTSKHMFA